MQGLIGKKIGMTRIFEDETGRIIPVTIVEIGMNTVQQIKTKEKDGYSSVQIGFNVCTEKKVSKSISGHCKKHKSEPTRITREFKLDSLEEKLKCGQKVGVEVFENVDYVNVVGTSKGRGFSGTVKRHGFHIGRITHGNMNKRARGSLGAGTYPARVFPGLKMAGQYGNTRITSKGIGIVGVDSEAGLLYLKGSIPGKNKGIVYIIKSTSKANS